MEQILYVGIDYLIEWTKLSLSCFGLLGMRNAGKKQVMAGFTGMLSVILIGTVGFGWKGNSYSFLVGCMAIVAVIAGLRDLKSFVRVILIYIGICMLDQFVMSAIMYATRSNWSDVDVHSYTALMPNIILIMPLVVLYMLRKYFWTDFCIENFPHRYIAVLMIGGLAIDICRYPYYVCGAKRI